MAEVEAQDKQIYSLRAAALAEYYSEVLDKQIVAEFPDIVREYYTLDPPALPHLSPPRAALWERVIWSREELHPRLARLQRQALDATAQLVSKFYSQLPPREKFLLLRSLANYLQRSTCILFDPLPVLMKQINWSRSSEVRAADS